MKKTIYDVAEEAGLSIYTVSRVINQKGGVSKKSENKVKAAIKKLNYAPDAAAQSLSTKYSNTIGLLIHQLVINTDYYMQMLAGVCQTCQAHGYEVLLMSDYGDSVEEFCSKVKARRKIDGLILPFGEVDLYGKKLYDLDFPIAYIGEKKRWDSKNTSVYGGYTGYRIEALNRLFENGCKKVLFIDGSSYHNREMQGDDMKNKSVIDKVIELNNLYRDQIVYKHIDGLSKEEFYEFLIEQLNDQESIDGIFYVDYMFTDQILSSINNSKLTVPTDIKVITTVHSEDKGVLYHPSISVMYIDAFQLGVNAALKLMNQIHGEISKVDLSYVSYRYIKRQSL